MRKKHYLILLGTRPEAIKLCPLILALRRCPNVVVRVVLTGQHRELPYGVLHFFGVRPDADLGVMRQNQTLTELSERLLSAVSRDLQESTFCPDAVIVHGDTTTAFVGALCAFYEKIPVYHVEAGLRTGDVFAPFPEEFNRRAIDAISTLCFAPTRTATRALLAEGVPRARILTVGNTATDALRLCLCSPCDHPLLREARGRRLILLTAHRREMSRERRAAMLYAVREAVEGREDVLLIFAVHPSPSVRQVAEEVFDGCANVRLCEPLDLPVLQHLLARATLLLTDSGGLQEEATYLGLPTLVLREQTERPEGVAAGVLRVVGGEPRRVKAAIGELLDDEAIRRAMARPDAAYGNGYVAETIARYLSET